METFVEKRKTGDFIYNDGSKVFFTSDTHFGHANIINWCRRPYSSVEEMNEALINNWNSVVGSEDTVYQFR